MDQKKMTVEKKDTPFNIIRHRGQPNRAQLPDGSWVYRQDKFFIPEVMRFIPAAPYDNHFIYEIPWTVAHLYPGSSYRCTCGSPAVWLGPSGYILDASAQGLMMVCLAHAKMGKHVDGGATWI